jgi:hypothetical protein
LRGAVSARVCYPAADWTQLSPMFRPQCRSANERNENDKFAQVIARRPGPGRRSRGRRKSRSNRRVVENRHRRQPLRQHHPAGHGIARPACDQQGGARLDPNRTKAIIAGDIDIYPEYTGNAAFFFNKADETVRKMQPKATRRPRSSTTRPTRSSGSRRRPPTTPGRSASSKRAPPQTS